MAGIAPSAVRATRRRRPISPPLRTSEPPTGLSRRDVLRRWEELEWWSCVYCDASFGPMVVAEADHITPLAKGGVHAFVNLAPACADCNRAKSDLDMSDWMALSAGQRGTEGNELVTRRARHTRTQNP
ncbi:HNH endonuclease [Streptomyces sp. NPDC058375]|uniref:HNH endonuclease n=1 Tax=Streptomyces sp. NPDC058375 TaxID=3346467 RepID=UPI00364E6498